MATHIMSRNNLRYIFPLFILFVILTALFIAGRTMLENWDADQGVLLVGNLIVFITVFVSYQLLQKAISSPNPQSFIRAMYGSFIIKFFLLALAAFVYIMITKKEVNKPALFTCVGIYFIYTFIEIAALMKLLKEKKNA
jgi:hypothetical protein